MILATLYQRPDGRQSLVEVTDIDPDDAMWLNQFGVRVSLEELPMGEVVVYGDYGAVTEDGDPDEVLVLSKGRTCVECMAELRKTITEKKYGKLS